MRSDITDLRLLRLAAFYESVYERFIAEIAERMAQDRDVRDGLRTLIAADGHAEAIVAETQRIAARLNPEDHHDLLRAALLDVAEIERSARDFYVAKMNEAHDERVVRLFQKLAYEEERHRRIAERLLVVAERRDHVRDGRPLAEDLQFLHDLEVFTGAGPSARDRVPKVRP